MLATGFKIYLRGYRTIMMSDATDFDIVSWFSTSVSHLALVTSGVLMQVTDRCKKCKSKFTCVEVENKGYKLLLFQNICKTVKFFFFELLQLIYLVVKSVSTHRVALRKFR
jgi:ABC-type protease/lipase transport system fused ATPase/permease subunit